VTSSRIMSASRLALIFGAGYTLGTLFASARDGAELGEVYAVLAGQRHVVAAAMATVERFAQREHAIVQACGGSREGQAI